MSGFKRVQVGFAQVKATGFTGQVSRVLFLGFTGQVGFPWVRTEWVGLGTNYDGSGLTQVFSKKICMHPF
jgi:hypothetical protein